MSMRILFSAFVLFATAATPAWAQVTVRYPTQLESHQAELQNGEIIVDVNVDGTLVHSDTLALIDAPAESIFRVVADFAGQANWVPDLTEARVISGSGERIVGQGTTDLAWPLTDRTWQINIYNRAQTFDGNSCFVSSWDYVPGSGDMIENDGYWLICPWAPDPSRSLVRYVFAADAGVSAPDFIERSVTANMVPNFINNLRQQVR